MPTLVAIGYPDETTAAAAADESRRPAADVVIGPGTSAPFLVVGKATITTA
jgi:hypothetical protein